MSFREWLKNFKLPIIIVREKTKVVEVHHQHHHHHDGGKEEIPPRQNGSNLTDTDLGPWDNK